MCGFSMCIHTAESRRIQNGLTRVELYSQWVDEQLFGEEDKM